MSPDDEVAIVRGTSFGFAAVLVAMVGMTPTVSAAAASDPMTAAPRCVQGSAIGRGADGLPVLLGACSDGSRVPASSPAPRLLPAPGPADCLVPGYDDRCESWAAPRYDGPWPGSKDYPGFGSIDRHTTVIPHPAEDLVFVGGTSTYTNGSLPDADFVAIAYRASTGQPVWTTVFGGLQELQLAYLSSIALSPDGERLYAIGTAAEPGVYAYEGVMVAFETGSGDRLWARRTGSFPDAIETGMTTLPDGTVRERIYLAGGVAEELPQGGSRPVGTVTAFDPADGSPIWTATFAGQTPDGARFNELVVSPDGSTIFAGGGEHLPSRLATNFVTVAFDATDGDERWVARDARTQPSSGNNGISDMQITPDGRRVVVTGFDTYHSGSLITGSSSAILTIAHETDDGAVAWRKAYGGPTAGETHFYFNLFQGMLAITPDGSTVVATAAINSHNNTGTVAYDVVTGTQKWGVESIEPAYVFTGVIGYYPSVAATNGRAFVSNRRGIGLAQYRTVTTAYGVASGTLDWTARLGGTGQTLFGGNAVSRDGTKLFVTATEQNATPGFPVPDPGIDTTDLITVAYDA